MKISKSHIILILVLVGVVVFAIFPNQVNHGEDNNNGTVVCASEAKICPDGTTIGRVAPDCEFALCPNNENNEDDIGGMIGGQRDENGCLGPAGYTFVESIGACAREWEIDSEDKRQAAKIVVEYVGFKKGLTVSEVKVFKCPGCFEVILDSKIILLQDWEVSSVDKLEPQIPIPEKDKDDVLPVSIEDNFEVKAVY